MSTVERLYAPISQQPGPDAAIGARDNKDSAIGLRRRVADRSFFWAMRLLPAQRRDAAHAVYNFYLEVDDIADGEASPSLKQILLLNWRSEIARLYGGQPRHAVTLGLDEATNAYDLRCRDFLAIIDGAEMRAQTEIRAPSFAQLDRYCDGG
jgi:presqualene diphosphate synthase